MSPNNYPFLGLIITPLLKVLLILWATNLSPHLWWPWWPPCHAKLLKWCPLLCHETMLLCFFPLLAPFPKEFSAWGWLCKYIQYDGGKWWWKEMKPVEDGRKEWLHASSTDFKLQIPLHNWLWPAKRLLQDVFGKNRELPVESPVASCRRLNRD